MQRIASALLLFVVGWFANAWHAANAHHEICPDHGELIDVTVAPACEDAGHSDVADHGETLNATHGGANDTHEHCAFVSLSKPSIAADAPRVAFHGSGVRPGGPAPTRAWFGDGERRFLLAPKQSPPTRGTPQA